MDELFNILPRPRELASSVEFKRGIRKVFKKKHSKHYADKNEHASEVASDFKKMFEDELDTVYTKQGKIDNDKTEEIDSLGEFYHSIDMET
jgi:hypothetical protein